MARNFPGRGAGHSSWRNNGPARRFWATLLNDVRRLRSDPARYSPCSSRSPCSIRGRWHVVLAAVAQPSWRRATERLDRALGGACCRQPPAHLFDANIFALEPGRSPTPSRSSCRPWRSRRRPGWRVPGALFNVLALGGLVLTAWSRVALPRLDRIRARALVGGTLVAFNVHTLSASRTSRPRISGACRSRCCWPTADRAEIVAGVRRPRRGGRRHGGDVALFARARAGDPGGGRVVGARRGVVRWPSPGPRPPACSSPCRSSCPYARLAGSGATRPVKWCRSSRRRSPATRRRRACAHAWWNGAHRQRRQCLVRRRRGYRSRGARVRAQRRRRWHHAPARRHP